MSVESILLWLGDLPIATLYVAMGIISAIENIFPPFPADIVVAFGSFLAARGKASPYSTFLVSWTGNVIGAAFMYYVGRRYGSGAFMSKLERWGGKNAEVRLRTLYARYGMPALFVSRFLPGVRALVPPFAGAMKLPPLAVGAAIALASGVWFAFITWIAFRAGEDWDVLYAKILHSSKIAGISGFALVAVVAAFFIARHVIRKRRNANSG
ncbi:MAG TPA: DedA family protein [Gemmatimonadaceae bacterium]|nr:DedA family protein [Gemmatimonadaceae bacterium]